MAPATARMKKQCPQCGNVFEIDARYCPRDGAELRPEVDAGEPSDRYIGTLIHGDIELRTVAGAGAMGRVYRAFQRGTDRDVAVKILHRELSGNTQLVQRFHREAKIASRLQHPHVVEVFLAGQLPDGALYIVMEFLDGQSLSSALASAGGALPLERALPIALQLCDAVGEGHARGVVHRDLKPENVMLVRRAEYPDWVKVLDFGIAKVSLGEQSMETQAGLIFGTARYISPEGAQGAVVGPPGDVYAIATMLYQMLAGRTPFESAQPVGFLIKHIHEPPPALTSHPAACGVPANVARVIMSNLAKDPKERAPNARAFGAALAAAAREGNVPYSDPGVVSRMGTELHSHSRVPIEPTLDDIAHDETAVASGTSSPPAPIPTPEITAPPTSESLVLPIQRRPPWALIALAFLLGAAVTALVVQQLHLGTRSDHDAFVARARRALAEERYMGPNGNNVRDLVKEGLNRWPDDADLIELQSQASHELVTRALAARSAGDLQQAHDLAKMALELDRTDHAAVMLVDQYSDELAGGAVGAPKALLTIPLAAHVGDRVELKAQVLSPGQGGRLSVQSPLFRVEGPGMDAGVLVQATELGTGSYHASVTVPEAANYDVVFEAISDGFPLRAERTLIVTSR